MECRQALEISEGNFEKALEWLRQKGIARAEKKAERETKAGLVASYTHSTGKVGVLVELACETDFVARTDKFQELAHELCLQAASMNPKDVEELLAQDYIRDPQKKVRDLLKENIGTIGENIVLRRFSRLALGE